MEKYRKHLGNEGEQAAADFLREEGFVILARNYSLRGVGEIDIVACCEALMLFIEVKSRKGDAYGGAIFSISDKKLCRLRKTAEGYLSANPQHLRKEMTYRFDLIIVQGKQLEWIRDILR